MSQNLKQFNFKLPEALLKQLDQLAETKGVTKTELVIQGIRQVLGLAPEKSPGSGIDSGIYEQLDRLEQRLQEFIDYQSAVDLKTYKRINALEEAIKNFQAQLSIPHIANNIVDTSTEEISVPVNDIVDDIASSLDTEKAETPTSEDIDSSIVNGIDSSIKQGQLELVQIDSDDKELVEKSKIVDSIEMLKTLRAEDPQGEWDNDRLTRHRRFKNLKGKWHKAGSLQFKYTGESRKVPNSQKIFYLWFLYQPDQP
jgi:predicted transcriptional regulator